MKKILFSVLILSAILVSGQESKLSKRDVKKHCTAFICVLESGDLNKALTFFDQNYVKAQHIKMLSSNTNLFITEFLAGNTHSKSRGNVFIVPIMKDINSIKVKKTHFDNTERRGTAEIEIKLNTGVKYRTTWTLVVGEDNKLYFFGAMG